MGPYVPTPKFLTISGDPGRVIYQTIDMRKFIFLLKSVFMVDVRFELKTTTAQVLSSTPYVKALVRWATGKKVHRSPTQTKPYNSPQSQN